MSRSRLLPYLLIAPSVVFLVLLFVIPLVQTIGLAFTGRDGALLENFRRLAGDINFGLSIRNTFLLVLTVIPLQIAFALAMAMMLQKLERGRDIALWIWT